MTWYKIDYEVDDGVSYTKDTALVMASNPDDANEKLRNFISAIDSETCVSKIYSTIAFFGDVFTSQHGCNK